MALPGIVVLLAARAVLGPSMWLSMAIFGVLLSPAFFRLVYASVTAVRNELYVDAARVSGLSDRRIIARHILTVVRAPVIIQAAMVTGIAIAIQAGLDFLGLGDLTIPTWGTMLNDGFANIYTNPLLVLWPSLAIALTCIALDAARQRHARRARAQRQPTRKRSRSGPAPRRTGVDRCEACAVIAHEDDAPVRQAPRRGAPATSRTCRSATTSRAASVKTVVHDVSLDGASRRGARTDRRVRLRQDPDRVVGAAAAARRRPGHRRLDRLRGQGPRRRVGEGDDASSAASKIAYIPQEPMSNLDPSFTIGSQLVEPMRVCLGISKAEAKERALDLLARVGIPNPKRTFAAYPHQVSGGMAQRVLIAGAVSCDPDLLIADEPTTALDVTVQAEVLDLLRDLQAELNMGVILVTHNFGVVADLCDRVSVMRDGRIVETGPVRGDLRRGPSIRTPSRCSPRSSRRASRADRWSEHRRPRYGGPCTADDPDRLDRSQMTELLLDAKDVVVEYPVKGFRKPPFRALKGVSLDIRPGETVGLVGESGSGKTTLGRAVLGLAPVTGGADPLQGSRHRAPRPPGAPRRCRARSRWCSRTRTPR